MSRIELRDAYELTEQQHSILTKGSTMTANDSQVGGQHYVQMDVQPWDVVDSWPTDQQIGYYRGNAIKYLMRMGSKDKEVQELKKARHYVDKLIETLEGK